MATALHGGSALSDRNREGAVRFLDREGRTVLRPVGRRTAPLADAYHQLLRMPWWRFILTLFATYAAIAACFAALYACDSRAVSGVRPGSFADRFFFSVETFATIGYGVYAPESLYGHCVVVVEAFVGMLAIALATGLAFSKFSLATARVLWSRRAVVAPFDGVSALMLRMANARDSQIAQAQLRVILLRDEVTVEGQSVRRMHDLKLARDWSPAFALTWLAHHRIDAASPLAGETPESLAAASAEIVATLIGIDETLGQTVHSRTSYGAGDILFGMRFVDVIEHGPWGRRLNYTKLDEIESL
jgi:inward rectifier potassium channel